MHTWGASVLLITTLSAVTSGETSQPLFLTDMIERGEINTAREEAFVRGISDEVCSYSGFLTVNNKFPSNLFFWFFPSMIDPDNAPVYLWINGGPGFSSLFGLFVEHGPFAVGKDFSIVHRNHTLVKIMSVIYLDAPVGTGYSYPENKGDFSKTQPEVAEDVYGALKQFFSLFPELQTNDFYLGGTSYAGKFISAIAFKIHSENPTSAIEINLQGMTFGNAFLDPLTMLRNSELIYNVGLLDKINKDYFDEQYNLIEFFILNEKWEDAFWAYDRLFAGSLGSSPSYFQNASGYNYIFNSMVSERPESWTRYLSCVTSAAIRRAIHVGNLTFRGYNKDVLFHFVPDYMQSVRGYVESLLDAGYKALFYNGVLDLRVPYAGTTAFLHSLDWKGLPEFVLAARRVWRSQSDGTIMGYTKRSENLQHVAVLNVGHLIAEENPPLFIELIDNFINGQ